MKKPVEKNMIDQITPEVKVTMMEEEIMSLKLEKVRLEQELISREELMTSLFAYIQTANLKK